MLSVKRKENIMICSNCSSEITDSAKFCPICGQKCAPAPLFCTNCGLELKAGSKFCSVCGTPVGAREAKPESIGYAGNIDAPENASDSLVAAMPAIPEEAPVLPESPVISEIPAGIPTPVNSAPTSGFGVPTPVNDAASAVTAPAASTPIYAGTPAAAPAQRVNLAKPTAQPDTTDFGDLGFAGAAVMPVTPIKKHGGGKIAVIICAAVAAVAVILAVVFLLNKGPIMNMFMGDSRYASMIEGRGLKTVSQYADSPLIAQGIKSASASYAASAAMMNNYDDDMYAAHTVMTHEVDAASQFAAMLEQYESIMLKTYGVNSLSVKLNTDIAVTDTAKALLFGSYATDEDKAEFDKALAALNSITLTYDITAEKDAAMFGAEMTEGGLTVNAQAFILSDGTVYLCFPFGSDKAIKYVVKDGETVFVEEAPELKFDEDEISRLIKEITDIYLRYYENSEIVIESDGELFASDAKAHGTLITATMNSALIEDMFAEIGRHIADDTYFSGQIIDYVNECGMELTLDEYKEDIIDAFADISADYSLIIRSVVDKNNNVLGKSYALNFDKSEDTLSYGIYSSLQDACFSYVESSDVFAAELEHFSSYGIIDNNTYTDVYTNEFNLSALVRKTSETDGSVSIKLRIDDDSYAANIEYSGAKTEKFLGNDVSTGTYTFTITPPADFTEELSSSDAAVLAALSAAKFTLSSEIDGGAYVCNFKVEVPQYGSFAVNTAVSGSDGKVTVPSGDVIEISDALAEYLSSYNFMYGYGSYNGTELSDSDKATMEELYALFAELKEKAASSDSYFAQYISEALEESADKLSEIPEPSASIEDIIALNSRADSDISRCGSISQNYYYISDELKDKLFDLSSRLGTVYYDSISYNMTQSQFDEVAASLDAMEKELDDIEAQAKNTKAPAKEPAVSYDFDSMSYEELLTAYYDLSYNYIMASLSADYDFIESDELSALAKNIETADTEALNSLNKISNSLSDGNLSVPLLRDARKKMKAFEEAVNEFLNAMTISQ